MCCNARASCSGEKFDQFDLSTNFIRWAYAVAYRESLKYLKQEGRKRQIFREAVLEKLAHTRSRAQRPARKPTVCDRRLRGPTVAERSGNHRALLLSGRKTAAEVAKELGRPTNTILKALIRIRDSLQRCIDEAVSSEERK